MVNILATKNLSVKNIATENFVEDYVVVKNIAAKNIVAKRLMIFGFAIFLNGCSDTPPIKITDAYAQYVGVWQKRSEQRSDGSIILDNMLLIINNDSTASYLKCEATITVSEGAKSSSRSSTSLPDAIVTGLSDSTVRVTQKLAWFEVSLELEVNRTPYQEDQRWYIDIEGKKLTKLTRDEQQTVPQWECLDSEDI